MSRVELKGISAGSTEALAGLDYERPEMQIEETKGRFGFHFSAGDDDGRPTATFTSRNVAPSPLAQTLTVDEVEADIAPQKIDPSETQACARARSFGIA